MAESKEELNILLMRVKEESEKASLKLNIMSDMRIATPVFFCFPFARSIFFHPLTFSLYVSLNFMLKSLSTVILEPKEGETVTVSTLSPSIFHEMIGLDAMIFVF